jgi:uncharacterized protein
VHPENYEIARAIHNTITVTGNINAAEIAKLKEQYGVGDTTISDITGELKKPGRDPREEYPKPIMRKGVMTFEDLSEGMSITGKIKNVVDFGAFVDLGIKETALVHISEMSDHFVKDPMEAVKVGDVLEFRILSLDRDRKRISLTRKTNPGQDGSPPDKTARIGTSQAPAEKRGDSGKAGDRKRPVLVKKVAVEGASREGSAGPAASGQRDNAAGRGDGGRRGGGYRDDHARRDGHDRGQRDSGRGDGHGRGQRETAAGFRDEPSGTRADDDGLMYNPFAEAFRKMQEKKDKR